MRKVSDLAPKNTLPPKSVIVTAVYTINSLLLRSMNNILMYATPIPLSGVLLIFLLII